MSWIVQWNGKEYDADPGEFSGLELKLIKERTGLGFWDLVKGIPRMDGEALRAVFWTVDRRSDPELKFSDYPGPSVRAIMPHLRAFGELVEELGKEVKSVASEMSGKPGGQDSPSSTPDVSTEPSTTD